MSTADSVSIILYISMGFWLIVHLYKLQAQSSQRTSSFWRAGNHSSFFGRRNGGNTSNEDTDIPSLLPSIDILARRLRENNLNASTTNCKRRFHTKCPMNSYVRYWRNELRMRDCYTSPLLEEEERFLVWEPDCGGWNNIRMGFELAVVLAHATGRTLVLPPRQMFYLLTANEREIDNLSDFSQFFNFEKLDTLRTIKWENSWRE